ncbi:MAG: hypothetical protein HY913_05750 [Desulfomonile tiedjei]|nr:hypothetical protein [Desulfomonile tiedjei]
MTKLSSTCLLALIVVIAAASPIGAYTVMHGKITTWSLGTNDIRSVGNPGAPGGMMNPQPQPPYPGAPQHQVLPLMGGDCAPGMNCGHAPAMPQGAQPFNPVMYHQLPAMDGAGSNLWY